MGEIGDLTRGERVTVQTEAPNRSVESASGQSA